MKTLIITFSLLISVVTFAQNDVNTALENALKHWNHTDLKSIENFDQISIQFPNDRLAQYYSAFTKTVTSFEVKDFLIKEKLVEQASKTIVELEKKYPNDAEILNLKALNLSAEIMLNPMVNGMLLMEDIQSIYAKSILLNPNNPRSILGKAEFNINTAKFIGGDIAKDCKAVRKAVDLFATENKNTLEPSWGKERAENLMKTECKSY